MAVYPWKNLSFTGFQLEGAEFKLHPLSEESVSPLSGDIQTTSLPGSRWGWVLRVPEQTWPERRILMAFLSKLNGREHRISYFDATRSKPAGTLPLSGVTVNAAAPQFAESLVLNTGVPGCTLTAGDWLGLGTADADQNVMVVDDAVADAGGLMTINFRNKLRATVPAGKVITSNQPRALYVLADPEITCPFDGGVNAPPMQFEIIEVFG